jgi:hypothetical protein
MNYRLIAKPLKPLKLSELPSEIANLIADTKLVGDIGEHLSITSFSHYKFCAITNPLAQAH